MWNALGMSTLPPIPALAHFAQQAPAHAGVSNYYDQYATGYHSQYAPLNAQTAAVFVDPYKPHMHSHYGSYHQPMAVTVPSHSHYSTPTLYSPPTISWGPIQNQYYNTPIQSQPQPLCQPSTLPQTKSVPFAVPSPLLVPSSPLTPQVSDMSPLYRKFSSSSLMGAPSAGTYHNLSETPAKQRSVSPRSLRFIEATSPDRHSGSDSDSECEEDGDRLPRRQLTTASSLSRSQPQAPRTTGTSILDTLTAKEVVVDTVEPLPVNTTSFVYTAHHDRRSNAAVGAASIDGNEPKPSLTPASLTHARMTSPPSSPSSSGPTAVTMHPTTAKTSKIVSMPTSPTAAVHEKTSETVAVTVTCAPRVGSNDSTVLAEVSTVPSISSGVAGMDGALRTSPSPVPALPSSATVTANDSMLSSTRHLLSKLPFTVPSVGLQRVGGSVNTTTTTNNNNNNNNIGTMEPLIDHSELYDDDSSMDGEDDDAGDRIHTCADVEQINRDLQASLIRRSPTANVKTSSSVSGRASLGLKENGKPRHRAKRRKVTDINSAEIWHCSNQGCERIYKRTSSISINKHKDTCDHRPLTCSQIHSLTGLADLSTPNTLQGLTQLAALQTLIALSGLSSGGIAGSNSDAKTGAVTMNQLNQPLTLSTLQSVLSNITQAVTGAVTSAANNAIINTPMINTVPAIPIKMGYTNTKKRGSPSINISTDFERATSAPAHTRRVNGSMLSSKQPLVTPSLVSFDSCITPPRSNKLSLDSGVPMMSHLSELGVTIPHIDAHIRTSPANQSPMSAPSSITAASQGSKYRRSFPFPTHSRSHSASLTPAQYANGISGNLPSSVPLPSLPTIDSMNLKHCSDNDMLSSLSLSDPMALFSQ